MENRQYPTKPVPLNMAARWLRGEIEAGRLPALIAGTAILVHVPTVLILLAERAKGSCVNGGDA